MNRFRTAVFLLAVSLTLAAFTGAHAAPAPAKAAPGAPGKVGSTSGRDEIAILAGGCFWCMETGYEGRAGIRSVVSGYSGGSEPNPTYEQVSAHLTGHREVIEIRFDPSVITYDQIIDIFWHSIDPTQNDGQFCDRGESYRSAIFYRGPAQQAVAEKTKKAIEASGVLKKPIVTELLPAGKFWPAEEYHQDFWKKDPIRYKTYRFGCGRDQRLTQLWGKAAAKPSVH